MKKGLCLLLAAALALGSAPAALAADAAVSGFSVTDAATPETANVYISDGNAAAPAEPTAAPTDATPAAPTAAPTAEPTAAPTDAPAPATEEQAAPSAPAQASDAALETFDAAGSGLDGFVTRLYQVCLDRTPDAAGKADWMGQLQSGKITGSQAAYGFIFSSEFKSKNYCNEHYVKQLYRAFMGREYDEAGLNNWVNKLNGGATKGQVFDGFVYSQEFQKICAGSGIDVGTGDHSKENFTAAGATQTPTVTPAPTANSNYTSIKLSSTAITMTAGDKATLTASTAPIDAGSYAQFVSSNEKVVTIGFGTVKAVGPGTATITATCEGLTATCQVTVNPWLCSDAEALKMKYFIRSCQGDHWDFNNGIPGGWPTPYSTTEADLLNIDESKLSNGYPNDWFWLRTWRLCDSGDFKTYADWEKYMEELLCAIGRSDGGYVTDWANNPISPYGGYAYIHTATGYTFYFVECIQQTSYSWKYVGRDGQGWPVYALQDRFFTDGWANHSRIYQLSKEYVQHNYWGYVGNSWNTKVKAGTWHPFTWDL